MGSHDLDRDRVCSIYGQYRSSYGRYAGQCGSVHPAGIIEPAIAATLIVRFAQNGKVYLYDMQEIKKKQVTYHGHKIK